MTAQEKAPPAAKPLAFFSDVHGNLEALEAVLRDLGRHGVVDLVALGDHLLGGEAPVDVWMRLQLAGAKLLRGVSETALVTIDPERLTAINAADRARLDRFRSTREALGELLLARIKRLPETVRIPMIDGREIVAVHGSPADPAIEIGHDLDDEEVDALIGDDPADIVICGASHVPFDRFVGEVRVVNVGAVGASPEGRVAHYTVIVPRLDGATIDQRYVEY